MAGYNPYNQNQSFAATQYFPQPQGNVYMVNNSLEVSNIPMGAGISVVLCPAEGTMYIKTLQGGAPTLMVYTIQPFEQKEKAAPAQIPEQPDYGPQIAALAEQIEAIQKQLKGGKINELL